MSAKILLLTIFLTSCASTFNINKNRNYVVVGYQKISTHEWLVILRNDNHFIEKSVPYWFKNYYAIGDTIN